MTNSEKLRSMTDEEIAAYICDIIEDCHSCAAMDLCVMGEGHGNGLLKWLKSEAKDDQV